MISVRFYETDFNIIIGSGGSMYLCVNLIYVHHFLYRVRECMCARNWNEGAKPPFTLVLKKNILLLGFFSFGVLFLTINRQQKSKKGRPFTPDTLYFFSGGGGNPPPQTKRI